MSMVGGNRGWRPEPECRKCGDIYGFLNSRPRYSDRSYRTGFGERLEWECSNCGYAFETPTEDQRAATNSSGSFAVVNNLTSERMDA